ncbi:MAG: NADH-quinone oxidoreductase subunit N [Planctomycetota bacterium]|nr:NADH-quinone oxidoreductase subunit N [Planctomycetota bacterium]MEC9158322.1 NADH-quinone oxidoreductase subunit N [Planctomycetota bacterium]
MEMVEKLTLITPDILLFVGAVVVAVLGLSGSRTIRKAVPLITGLFLIGSVVVTQFVYADPAALESSGLLFPKIGGYVKSLTGVVGLGLVALGTGTVDRAYERAVASGSAAFDPLRVVRGEYHAFLLLSLAGVMLVCNATDLIWLFLALELSVLPTYVMVALSRNNRRANESAIKYFFLGAMSTALFLYGFAMLYGATGSLNFIEIRDVLATQAAGEAGIAPFAVVGMGLALLGIFFKISAVPMHVYAPDVYEGASNPMTGFLSIVPKIAGFVAIIVLCGTFGWAGREQITAAGTTMVQEGLPAPISAMLWMVAVLTMTLGNIGALLQKSIKRLVAYSGITHSGYMLIGIVAGTENGTDALLFYLAAYSLGNLALFGVLAGLTRMGQDIESFDDLAGLWRTRPRMATMMALAAGSFVGMPPLIGFWGKLMVFIAGVESGHVVLVCVAAVNSAISSWYYLHLAGVPVVRMSTPRSESVTNGPRMAPRLVAVICGVGLLVVPVFTTPLYEFARTSMRYGELEEPAARSVASPTTPGRELDQG